LARQAILLAAQAQSASVVEEARLRVQQAKARRGAAERRLAQAWEAEEDRKRRLAGLAPQLDGFLRERAAAEVMGRKAEAERREAEAAWEQLRVTKQEIGAQRAAVAEELQQLRGALGSLNEAMRQHEIDRTRAEAKRATAFERLFEEYGLGEEAAVEMAVGLTLAPDAQVVVSRLRREIRELGEVSLGSIDAFDELNGRLQEMVGQRDDVLDGIAQVEASITELDRLTRGRFLATFADVRQAFGEMFTRMFDGGEATLELSSDDKLLESGVEVAVTLPGKKRQSLALLSGGERALCASAFLFALLKTRPSPLVVLDEVDAPLDGRNVERFASVLQELAQEIQFLVITHNPRTIELAPIWLGVTMQEPGVSSLLPTRVPPTA
jgi:chromosome segregation protein